MLRPLAVAAMLAAAPSGAVAAASSAPAATPASFTTRSPAISSFTDVTLSPRADAVLALESQDPDGRDAGAMLVVYALNHRSISSMRCRADRPRKRALTGRRRGACRLASPVWSPDGGRIAVVAQDTTARTSDLFLVDLRGDRGRRLLHFNGLLDAARWSPDGRSLAVLATAAPHKQIGATQAGAAITGDVAAALTADVQRLAIVTLDGRLRYASPPDLFIYEYDWTPDGRGFAATGAHGNGDNSWWTARLYGVDAARASVREIVAPTLQITQPRVSADGRSVAFIGGLMSDFGSVGGDIFVVPWSGGAAIDVTPEMPASATSLGWRGRSDRITFTALAGEKSAIETVDVATKRIEMLWSGTERISAGGGMRVSFARSGAMTAIAYEDFEHPPAIGVGPVGAWTNYTQAGRAIAPAVRAESVAWTSDGFHVQGWLLEPRRIEKGRTYPLIVEVHGGPSAAATPGFVGPGTLRDLIERGYYVFEPNSRGSFGQGEAFAAANVRDIGGGDLRDILSGIDAVERVAPIDDARIGILGHSYGGYMAMWAVTQTHRFKAAVAGAGIANWQSYYGENGIDQWMIPFFGASVYDDPAVYAKSSPMTFIKQVTTPTFAYVGERDVECPAPQSLEFFHALQTLGVPSSLVIYPGEGHGIRDAHHRRDLRARIVAWFDRYLR
ncbi:MAG: S9 family peptidase [Candidatus Eremiobacteraeota bacterium]|nr:S9 family peptidase [Candidatus Eremiobacteraeota bacterium]